MSQLIENGVIPLDFVKSESNLVDSLPKGLTKKLVQNTSRGTEPKSII